MLKIILINPPSPYLVNDAAYPPSGLLYLASAMEKAGHAVSLVDLTGNPDWRSIVGELEADLFGITCVTPNVPLVSELSRLLPLGRPVIIGGAHPTFLPKDALKQVRCDAIVRGEAEEVIETVLNDLRKRNLKRVYEGGIAKVEAIPKPSRHLVDLHRYTPGGEKTTPIYTSRGCPYQCSFCSKISGKTYRVLSLERVLSEIEDVMNAGFNHILLGDDNLLVQRERFRTLMKAIKPFGLRFRLNQDARAIDGKMMHLAREAGCREVSFGIETGSQKMLDLMNKQTTVEANRKAILVAKEHDIKTKAYFIVNFPGENDSTVDETLEFARQAKPDSWLLSSFAPLPGSDTFQNPMKYGITWVSPSWEDYYLVGKAGKFSFCFTTQELSFDKQSDHHRKMFNSLQEILGPLPGTTPSESDAPCNPSP
jgi:anaerobic magnesium-protoporphyrin IX monomethyl ester cyclase